MQLLMVAFCLPSSASITCFDGPFLWYQPLLDEVRQLITYVPSCVAVEPVMSTRLGFLPSWRDRTNRIK
jgi:hypothetical protein